VRVLLDYRPALRERTGVGEYAHQLVMALAQLRPSPVALTLFSSSFKDRLRAEPLEAAGVATIDRRVPVRALNWAWHRLGWPNAELVTGQRFDVTHSLHPLILPSRHAAHVITIHDLDFLVHPERTTAEIRRDYPGLAPAHARRADRIIVPSRFTAGEVVRRFNIDPGRISVCSPGAPPWAPRTASPAGGYILFFGTLEPRKNVGVLLDAYERLLRRRKDVPRLLLAGRTTDEAAPWLERIARPPLVGFVTHAGYVDPAQRQELYSGASLLVQPSLEEGFGLPVLEAMTLGVPVVAANRGALPEVLGGAGTLVEADDPEAMANAMERLVDQSPLAASHAALGIERAKQFSWLQTAERVVEAYRLAMEHRACVSA